MNASDTMRLEAGMAWPGVNLSRVNEEVGARTGEGNYLLEYLLEQKKRKKRPDLGMHVGYVGHSALESDNEGMFSDLWRVMNGTGVNGCNPFSEANATLVSILGGHMASVYDDFEPGNLEVRRQVLNELKSRGVHLAGLMHFSEGGSVGETAVIPKPQLETFRQVVQQYSVPASTVSSCPWGKVWKSTGQRAWYE